MYFTFFFFLHLFLYYSFLYYSRNIAAIIGDYKRCKFIIFFLFIIKVFSFLCITSLYFLFYYFFILDEYILTRTRLNANDATLCDEKTLQTYSQQLVADKKLPKRGVVETTSSDQEGPQSLDINTSVQILNFSSIPIAHFGFHFNEDGLCVDKNIVEKVLVLMKALAIHEYDPEIMTNNTKEEKVCFIYSCFLLLLYIYIFCYILRKSFIYFFF